jgi:hypothetical protein
MKILEKYIVKLLYINQQVTFFRIFKGYIF